MTGAELLERLSRLAVDELALPVLAITCNTPEGEGARAGSCPGAYPWIPDPVLLVATLDAELSHQWWEARAGS